jgi:heme o synthase
MKPCLETESLSPSRMLRDRTSDLIELTKPKLTLLVLFTAFVGFCTGISGSIPFALLLHLLIGTALMSGGASAFNMYTEQQTDALMDRTALRPIVSGRLRSGQALLFAFTISLGGLVYLYVLVNHLTSLLSAIILACYLFLYTPLKTKTWLCTLVGAVPGALPIVMGWTAATGSLASGAWVLFAIVFCWQMPHFYAIGWMYRDDYRKAGLPVLSVIDMSGKRTGRQAVSFIFALVLISLLPLPMGLSGRMYPVGAAILGMIFLGSGIHFAHTRDLVSARRLFMVSAIYLPALLLLLVADKLA